MIVYLRTLSSDACIHACERALFYTYIRLLSRTHSTHYNAEWGMCTLQPRRTRDATRKDTSRRMRARGRTR